ncbi:methyltransferase domain-containing protein [Candidatus Uhrbacteria bacterium]|nr:methyltransferase domain-containing protein [Candidatus Uhrbacteria bacterium]
MALTGGTELINPYTIFERVGLRAGMATADLGCGVTGHYIVPAARIVGAEGKAYAVDIQKSALAATESRAKLDGVSNVTSVWADIERLGATRIPAVSLDVAMIVNTLFLARDRNQMMAEAARLTKPGGTVLVVEWKTDATAVGPPAAQRIGKDIVRAAATSAKLQERTEFEAGPYHYGLVFTK